MNKRPLKIWNKTFTTLKDLKAKTRLYRSFSANRRISHGIFSHDQCPVRAPGAKLRHEEVLLGGCNNICWNCSLLFAQKNLVGMAKRNKKGQAAQPVLTCSISGIGQEWDLLPGVRARLRDGGGLLEPETVMKREDVKVCALNKEVMFPLLRSMHASSRQLPSLNDLRDEIHAALTLNKRHGDDLTSLIEETAHQLKKYCGFIKAKVRRHEVSTATWPKKNRKRCGSKILNLDHLSIGMRNTLHYCLMWHS